MYEAPANPNAWVSTRRRSMSHQMFGDIHADEQFIAGGGPDREAAKLFEAPTNPAPWISTRRRSMSHQMFGDVHADDNQFINEGPAVAIEPNIFHAPRNPSPWCAQQQESSSHFPDPRARVAATSSHSPFSRLSARVSLHRISARQRSQTHQKFGQVDRDQDLFIGRGTRLELLLRSPLPCSPAHAHTSSFPFRPQAVDRGGQARDVAGALPSAAAQVDLARRFRRRRHAGVQRCEQRYEQRCGHLVS